MARTIILTRTTRVALMWEVFYVSNRPHYTAVNDPLYTVSGTTLQRNPLFGQRLDQAAPRMMRVAGRVER